MQGHGEKSIEVEGKNVEEALQAACDMLDTTPNQVDYEVSESNKGGMLGFLKGKVYKVRVWEKSASERMLKEMLDGLFSLMGFGVEYKITRAEDAYEVDLETDGADGLLIGRGGETLTGLQHLISRMAGHRDENIRVRVDVAGYRKRRHEQLRRKARDLADRADDSGRDIMTEPLAADERRIVHLALAEDSRVQTRAVGEGTVKRVAVIPQGRGGARTAGGRSGSGRTSGGRASRGRGQGGRSGAGGGWGGRRGDRGGGSRGERSGSRSERDSGRGERERDRGRGGRGRGRSDRSRSRPGAAMGIDVEGTRRELEEQLVGERDRDRKAAAAAIESQEGRAWQSSPAREAPDTPAGAHEPAPERGAEDGMPREPGEDRSSAPARKTRRGSSAREQERSPLDKGSDDYFRIPDALSEAGDGPEADAGTADGEKKDSSGESKPMTYGRRPSAGRRRRR